MKLKKLSELLNVDVRRAARQKYKKDMDVCSVTVEGLENGGYSVEVKFDDVFINMKFVLDCHGHLVEFE